MKRSLDEGQQVTLRGEQGPAGPSRPAGTAFRAVITAGGTQRRATPWTDSNEYLVRFAGDISNCAAIVTLGTSEGAVAPARRITVAFQQGGVLVRTYDPAGTPAPAEFHLMASC